MSAHREQLLGQLHKLVAELEGLAQGAADAAQEGGEQLADSFRESLAGARERIRAAEETLERDLRKHGRAVERKVRENVWVSIGLVAVAAFLLGALARRRD
jgi:ElaB/YqjD/DUF883 family membrane-anchored ribosome-binding protein